MSMFNVTTVLDNNIVVHEDVGLTASVVHVFIVIVVVITNQTRVRLGRVRAEIYRLVEQVVAIFRTDGRRKRQWKARLTLHTTLFAA